jgi:hypothetical protein
LSSILLNIKKSKDSFAKILSRKNPVNKKIIIVKDG